MTDNSTNGNYVGGTITAPSPQPENVGQCPCCGYCPHCGRGGHRFVPYNPWPWNPSYPNVVYYY